MNHATEAAALVAFLGEYTGNPGLVLNANGHAAAEIEGVLFSFFYEADHNALFIQAALGTPSPAALEPLMLCNHLWEGTAGGIFGVNPEDGIVYYSYRLDFPLADEGIYPEFLCDLMGGILGAIEVVMEEIFPEQQVQATMPTTLNPADAV